LHISIPTSLITCIAGGLISPAAGLVGALTVDNLQERIS